MCFTIQLCHTRRSLFIGISDIDPCTVLDQKLCNFLSAISYRAQHSQKARWKYRSYRGLLHGCTADQRNIRLQVLVYECKTNILIRAKNKEDREMQ